MELAVQALHYAFELDKAALKSQAYSPVWMRVFPPRGKGKTHLSAPKAADRFNDNRRFIFDAPL